MKRNVSVVRFKFRCNILLISGKIIKEMPGSVASGTHCTTPQLAEGIMADFRRDFWIRETGTGHQVAQLHIRYTMMMVMMMMMMMMVKNSEKLRS